VNEDPTDCSGTVWGRMYTKPEAWAKGTKLAGMKISEAMHRARIRILCELILTVFRSVALNHLFAGQSPLTDIRFLPEKGGRGSPLFFRLLLPESLVAEVDRDCCEVDDVDYAVGINVR
jgi:hypothetical protein